MGYSFLEHPRDPMEVSASSQAHKCSSLWVTRAYIKWANQLHHHRIKFDQCRLGQMVVKATTLSTDLPLLMELVLFLHCEGCSIAPNHVPREYNTWADELTHPDFEGFSLDCRLPAAETLFVFPFATRLLSSTGFS